MGLFGSSPKKSTIRRAERTIAALQELQETLHLLTPAEKSEVRCAMPFASPEWLDGLALSCRPRDVSVRPAAAMLDQGLSTSMVDARVRLTADSTKLVLILVGLPARGKSMLGHKLEQFLGWRGYNTKTFRVGARRREMADAKCADARPETASASFFDATKMYAAMVREKVSLEAFDETLSWLQGGGEVAIFDASNVTLDRRARLLERVRAVNDQQAGGVQAAHVGVVFLESIVTDPEVIQQGMDFKITHSADFAGLEPAEAYKDLAERIGHYEKSYETVRQEEGACAVFGDIEPHARVAHRPFCALPAPVALVARGRSMRLWTI